jgi:hypothetical protein
MNLALVFDITRIVRYTAMMNTSSLPTEAIREAIRRDGRSLRAIGIAADGLDSGILSRFMRGERGMTLDSADALCRAMGVEVRLVKPRTRKGV